MTGHPLHLEHNAVSAAIPDDQPPHFYAKCIIKPYVIASRNQQTLTNFRHHRYRRHVKKASLWFDQAFLLIALRAFFPCTLRQREIIIVLRFCDGNRISIVGPTYFMKGNVMYAIIFMIVVVLISFGVGAFVGREAEKLKLFGANDAEEQEAGH